VNIYHIDFSNVIALLIAFRTGSKRVSYVIILRVIRATGEALMVPKGNQGGRGSVVLNIPVFRKGPKYQNKDNFNIFTRSYSTRGERMELGPV